MKRVTTGELKNRLRKRVTDQLTENPERTTLGVLAFIGLEIESFGSAESARAGG